MCQSLFYNVILNRCWAVMKRFHFLIHVVSKMSTSVLLHVSVISIVVFVAFIGAHLSYLHVWALCFPHFVWQFKCLIIYTPHVSSSPHAICIHITFRKKYRSVHLLTIIMTESRALWWLHRQKNPPHCFQLFSSFTSANGRRWCWGEGCLWETETASPFSIFHPRLSPPTSSLCWHASYRLPGHVRRAQSGLITLYS